MENLPDELAISYEEAKKTTTDMFNPVIWTQMKGMAETFRQSGGLPKALDTVPKIILVMQAGREMGMAPVESTQDLYPVNGAVNIWGKAIAKRLRKFGWEIDFKDEVFDKDAEAVTAVVWRYVKVPGTTTYEKRIHEQKYTFQMAKDSGYTIANNALKVGWKLGANRMKKLRYGALNMIIQTRLGDVLGAATGIVEVEEDIVLDTTPVIDPANKPAIEAPKKGTATDVAAFLSKAKEKKENKDKKVNDQKAEDADIVDEPADTEKLPVERVSEETPHTEETAPVTDLNKMEKKDVIYSTKKAKEDHERE